MAKFDPDAFIREMSAQPAEAPTQAAPPQSAPAFDPDAFLRGAKASAIEPLPGPRRSYAATEVPGAAMQNLPGSAKQFATGLYEAVTNPLDTLTAVLDLGAGALRKSLPSDVVKFVDQFGNPQATQRAVDVANKVGGAIADRYGSWDSIKRTFAEDPVGAAGDLSTLLFGGATIGRTAAGATALAGAPGVARPIAQAAEGIGRAAVYTDPLSAVTIPAQMGLEQIRKVAPSPLTAQQQANLPRDKALERARAEGYVAPPGSVDPVSGKFIVAERLAGKTLLEQMMSVRNQETTNKLARRAVGVGEDTPLTSDAMLAVRREAARQGYDPVKQVGNVVADNQYLNDLSQIESAFVGQAASFPAAVPDTVTKLVNQHLVGNFDSADAIKRIQDLRNQASASFRKNEPDIGNAQRAVAKALEDQIERSIGASGAANAAEILDNFRAARQRMAVSHSIEDAIREGTGNVSAVKLANDLQRGKYLTGDLKIISEFSSRFPRVSQLPSQIGTPSSGAVLGLDLPRVVGGTLGAIGGGALGGMSGATAGGMAGAVAPNVMASLMRRHLMSEGAQRAAVPRYDPAAERLLSDIAARNALMMEQSGEVRDIRNALMGGR